MKVIFVALAMLIFSAPVLAQETGVLVAQAGDNRPATRGDFYRLDGNMDRLDQKIEDTRSDLRERIDAQGRDLGARIDALSARIDALGARIDTLTTAVWAILGAVIAALLGIIAMQMRREKTPAHSAPPSGSPVSAPR